jgi:hypothetical protein
MAPLADVVQRPVRNDDVAHHDADHGRRIDAEPSVVVGDAGREHPREADPFCQLSPELPTVARMGNPTIHTGPQENSQPIV